MNMQQIGNILVYMQQIFYNLLHYFLFSFLSKVKCHKSVVFSQLGSALLGIEGVVNPLDLFFRPHLIVKEADMRTIVFLVQGDNKSERIAFEQEVRHFPYQSSEKLFSFHVVKSSFGRLVLYHCRIAMNKLAVSPPANPLL
jgi:hypothetical protein